MTRYVQQREMSGDERTQFDAWLVFHGINLREARALELTRHGYLHVHYRDGEDLVVRQELEAPAWL